MRCAVIKDGAVQNIIEIRPAHKMGYERATESKLVELSEDMNVAIGDVHDAETGMFLRDGVEVGPDDVLPALRGRMEEAEGATEEIKIATDELTLVLADMIGGAL